MLSTKKLACFVCTCSLIGGFSAGAVNQIVEKPVQFNDASISAPQQPAETAYPDVVAPRATDTFTISNWASGSEHTLFSDKDLTYNENTTVSGTWDNSGAKLTIKLYRYTSDGAWVLQQMNTNMSNDSSTVVTSYGTGRYKLTATPSAPIAQGTLRVTYNT